MRSTLAAAAMLAAAILTAPASAGNRGGACIARVLHSEQLPYAPPEHWLAKVALEITPPDGRAYEIELQHNIPWQGPPPRRGQTFMLLCDPANPGDLHLIR
jgi:hypothetical protein